jgi:4-hydroxy-tetrahydrodipicolinate synthase
MLDGKLDTSSLHRLLEFLGDNVAGVLVGGSTGEVASLTVVERIQLMKEVRKALNQESVLAVSIADNSIETSRQLAFAADDLQADLAVVSCPNYFPNDRPMLVEYFAAVAEMTSAELCLYDNPVASNTLLSVEDIKACASGGRLTHIKVTDRALEKVDALRRETNLTIFAGDDAVLWHQIMRGAHGGMVASPLIYPERTRALWQFLGRGDEEAAYAIYTELAPVIEVCLTSPDYVQAVKLVLHDRGVIASPEVRLPLLAPGRYRCKEVRQATRSG